MPQPTVSVIVPTFNRADSLGEALDSILSQVPPADDVIVVDDGSTDGTGAVLAGFGSRIVALSQPNGGAAAARNAGIARATGTWLAFLDSDDLWLPGRLGLFHRDIAGAPADTVAHVANFLFDGAGHDLFSGNGADFPEGHAVTLDAPFDSHVPGPYLQAAVLRTDAVRAAGGFDTRLPIHEDVLLFRRMALSGSWRVTGDAAGRYRRLPGDGVALMDWEETRPVPFYTSRVQCNESLLSDPRLGPKRRARVARDLSGAWFQLARSHAEAGEPKAARAALARSVRCHPVPRTALRAILPLLIGQGGYDMVLNRRRSSLRPDEPAARPAAG